MEQRARDFLVRLLQTPGPSGYEQRTQEVVRHFLRGVADQVTTDSHGNVVGAINVSAPVRLMLAGHCDHIGLIVQYVDSEGYIFVQPIGEWDPVQLVGSRVVIWSSSGPVVGVVSRKPVHLLTDDERRVAPRISELWIDIGARDKVDAESVVRVGDSATFELEFRELRHGLMSGVGLDDRIGLWIALEAFRRVREEGGLSCALFVASTVQEEVGLRGAQTCAYGVNPHVAIAIDVTHATDCPAIDKRSEGDIAVGRGPVVYRGPNTHPKVVDRLVDVATARQIRYQIGANGRGTPTDANIFQTTRAGVATGLISIPCRYMHSSVETVSLDDAEGAVDLLTSFVLSVGEDHAWTP